VTELPQGDAVEQQERGRVGASELSWAVRSLVRASTEVDRALASRLGLRPLDYAAMNHVMSGADPLGPAEVSARLGISTGSGTELVDRLERAGHLRRERHPTDRRRVRLQPTDATAARVVDTLRPLLDDLDAVAAGFTPEEEQVVLRYLRAVEESLRRYTGDDGTVRPG